MFTGGSGKAGRHVLPWLLGGGYEILNFDLQPFENTDIFWLIGDVTDSGQVFNAMTMHFGRKGLLAGKPPNPVDAVVHFAAIPRVFIKADNETYRVNVMGTYNVIEAAMKLGIRKVVIASSETTYGVCFAEGDKDFHGFPLQEDYDVDPMDSYGLSKVVNERTARAFAMRFGADIYALRIANVISRTNKVGFPASSVTRHHVSAMPGVISTRAISGRSCTCACRRMDSAFRSSTLSTTPLLPTFPPPIFWRNGARACQ
jgi:UDP-glucose 4-epimerase